MKRGAFQLAPVLASMTLWAGVASADTEVHVVSKPLTTTDWTEDFDIPQFDDTNRILQSVTVELAVGFTADIQFENTTQTTEEITVGVMSEVTLFRPTGIPMNPNLELAKASKTFSVTETVGPYDNTTDFGGDSGHSEMGLSDNDSDQYDSAMPPSMEDLDFYVGVGTIMLHARAVGTQMSTGPSNLVTQISNKSTATVTVTYTFGEDCNNNKVDDGEEIQNDPSLDQAGDSPLACGPDGILDECQNLEDCNNNQIPDVCDIANNDSQDLFTEDGSSCGPDGIPDDCQTFEDCNENGIPDVCDIVVTTLGVGGDGQGPGSTDCNENGVPDECEPDCDEDGVPDDCDDECLEDLDCEEFDRYHTLTPNDTYTVFTNNHNPEQAQGFAYVYAVDQSGDAIAADYLIGNQMVFNGMTSFSYSVNPVDYRAGAGLAPGDETDADGDGVRDLDGVEYDKTAGQILVPRFIGQVEGVSEGELVLIGLSGGRRFTTTAGLLIYNDNEDQFSAQHTFRCWDKVDLRDVSMAFSNDFLKNFSGNNQNESLGMLEYGWYRVFGSVAVSNWFDIFTPAIYAVHLSELRVGQAADLPFETCTRSGHLFPNLITGDNSDQLPPDLECGGAAVARNLPGSLLLFTEFDNRHGNRTVFTVTNVSTTEDVRVHYIYIGRFGNL